MVIPKSIRIEHEELHSELKKATRERGALGNAAKEVAKLLDPHFAKEEEYALPPLGLLNALAEGRVSAKMKDGLAMTNRLKADLDQMLKEHKQIVVALKKLTAQAKKEKKLQYAEFAKKLILHARTEEEVLYPASLLVGKYLKLRLKKAHE